MTEGQARLAADWLTIWHSEAAALAEDRELREAWQRMMSGLAAHGAAFIQAALHHPSGHDPSGGAGSASPPGTPSAGDASVAMAERPDQRDAVIADLQRRIAALERRDP